MAELLENVGKLKSSVVVLQKKVYFCALCSTVQETMEGGSWLALPSPEHAFQPKKSLLPLFRKINI